MNRVIELENALAALSQKGTEVGYTETEIDDFLEDIDYDTLLQAIWNNAETVYAYRADGKHTFSMDYRGTELFKQRATLLYDDMGGGCAGTVIAARSMELWLLEDIVLATLKSTRKNRTGGKIEEEKEKKKNGKEETQIYSGIQGTNGGAIQIRHTGQGTGAAVRDEQIHAAQVDRRLHPQRLLPR